MAVQFDSAPLFLFKGGVAPSTTAAGTAPGFADALQSILASVENTAGEANTAVTGMIEGSGDVHDEMLALQRAETTFQLTMQVRNKLMAA
jgi:flagellar hook-basal body complex protein FliE